MPYSHNPHFAVEETEVQGESGRSSRPAGSPAECDETLALRRAPASCWLLPAPALLLFSWVVFLVSQNPLPESAVASVILLDLLSPAPRRL